MWASLLISIYCALAVIVLLEWLLEQKKARDWISNAKDEKERAWRIQIRYLEREVNAWVNALAYSNRKLRGLIYIMKSDHRKTCKIRLGGYAVVCASCGLAVMSLIIHIVSLIGYSSVRSMYTIATGLGLIGTSASMCASWWHWLCHRALLHRVQRALNLDSKAEDAVINRLERMMEIAPDRVSFLEEAVSGVADLTTSRVEVKDLVEESGAAPTTTAATTPYVVMVVRFVARRIARVGAPIVDTPFSVLDLVTTLKEMDSTPDVVVKLEKVLEDRTEQLERLMQWRKEVL